MRSISVTEIGGFRKKSDDVVRVGERHHAGDDIIRFSINFPLPAIAHNLIELKSRRGVDDKKSPLIRVEL